MLKTIIVDDEVSAVERMERLLCRDGKLKIEKTFTNAEIALKYCENKQVDVVFLDIEMPGLDGIHLGQRLLQINPNINLVYVTAYDMYALQAYGNYPFAYLLKPIAYEKVCEVTSLILKRDCHMDTGIKQEDLIYVEVIGEKQITYKGQKVVFRTHKAEELFLLLLYHKGKSLKVDYIYEMLWPEIDIETSKKYLHTHMYYCRKAFKDIGVEDLIGYQLNQYSMDMTLIEIDCDEMLRVIEEYNNKPLSKKEFECFQKTYKGGYLKFEDYLWAEEQRRFIDLRWEAFCRFQKSAH